jgi:hypothetical protein
MLQTTFQAFRMFSLGINIGIACMRPKVFEFHQGSGFEIAEHAPIQRLKWSNFVIGNKSNLPKITNWK